ncbi:protein OCTOPUS-like [Abrus precatorius]|uniref:Protein OCTOPUS-like n=1 Tax=Abrus precatorius TaxID=3816 RepID=A0A8B8JLW7_ABRPR|nr:protein OCTOPUS-like [Abrus precatorius]
MTSKPHRLSACHRHPTVPVTGFCALCLRERLYGIHSNDSPPPPDLRRSKSCSRSTTADASSEPRRRSCEVRPRSSLSDLFSLDDCRRGRNRKPNFESVNLGEIRVCDGDDDEETKTVKEFIDLELQRRKKSAGRDSRTFWNAATAFGEKFRKWKWKHKSKKNLNGNDTNRGVEKRRARRLRDTQSEIGECNFGRRSCDTDPRLSIDGGRISMDCPRASWDGCLIGKACSRLSPMVSLEEDDANDGNSIGLESAGDRRSYDIDRSNSPRRRSISEVDELKLMSNANANAKVSPATFYSAKLLITEKELMDSYVKSSSDVVQSDSIIESDSKDAADVVATGVRQKGFKKLHKWRGMWNKLGLAQRRECKLGEEECDSGVVVNKPLGDSLQRLRRVVNVQASEPVGPKLMRSYSVSCRSPCRVDGFVNSVVEDPEAKGNVLNGRQEFMFQRNRSVRYSPNNPDTGLLRFYLTPSKSYRRSKSGRSSMKDLHSIARSGL